MQWYFHPSSLLPLPSTPYHISIMPSFHSFLGIHSIFHSSILRISLSSPLLSSSSPLNSWLGAGLEEWRDVAMRAGATRFTAYGDFGFRQFLLPAAHCVSWRDVARTRTGRARRRARAHDCMDGAPRALCPLARACTHCARTHATLLASTTPLHHFYNFSRWANGRARREQLHTLHRAARRRARAADDIAWRARAQLPGGGDVCVP